ncbi:MULTISPECIES: helix-turn-helix domain-containing protein [Winogradskyella]|uniref:Helix-turn-helix domain-containing protein n=2 Tax=Winogradskyella TaxID=286104 RepID=A0ABT7ZUU8_9FLAO|nr:MULTISPECIES: helix-turn-helix domain-containing protein [Winogradskyella]MBC3844957.1 helix-turn-helix domain-containing protein [Winogradskyella echinorum]MBC5749305.1 helix-turn-helix domain-containing protein [Winogradskyella echinorum]MDN3492780.1 helix-turn-helix domain-containing protein [Winogradskyella bathintestinalis]
MSKISYQGKFIEQAEALILENISNEQFGVSELAELMNMSRSNLLRKIKKQTQGSASQFIREVRLQKGMTLLEETELTISEISYQVGFSNNSYFTKCFKDYYGYSPGEARKKIDEQIEFEQDGVKVEEDNQNKDTIKVAEKGFFQQYRIQILFGIFLVLVIAAFSFYPKKEVSNGDEENANSKKSIAVLPFKNMSSDSDNLYFVNGLMESTLNNLQKIEDIRVISRTSVEKYRDTDKTILEIAQELNVNYLIEGSGQRAGDQVLLNIQLIDASMDTPIWAEQYNHKTADIFSIQNEVAKKIAEAIEVTVTPAELKQIDKKPTENVLAYDYYLKGLEALQTKTEEGLQAAISSFEKAIENDSKFALAYAQVAICYYYLDVNKIEKKYLDKLNEYADNSLLYDSTSELSLIAKALYYINANEFRLAIPYLEKALDYNPNASSVVLILSDIYARVVPDTKKYLTYALKGIKLNIEANDSVSKSFIYLNLSNALVQNGFAKEASKYIEESLKYNPKNQYSTYLKNFIDYANNKDLESLRKKMLIEWRKDTTRADITQELAKTYYFQEDYEKSLVYYEKYISILTTDKIDLYPAENIKIAYTYKKLGLPNKAEKYIQKYKDYLEEDESIYREASLAMLYLYENIPDKAIEAYDKFSSQDGFQYWVLLFMKEDPLLNQLQNHPRYDETIEKIEVQFWEKHKILKETLKKEKLL